MTSPRIRFAEDTDEDGLFALVSAFPTSTPPDFETFHTALHEKLADPASCIAVAQEGGALNGYVSGYSHPTFYAAGPTAWVDELFVKDALRRRGVGRSLMEFFESWAQAEGCALIGLATAGVPDFYARLGFESKAGYYKKYLAAPR